MPVFRKTLRQSKRLRRERVDRVFELMCKAFLIAYFAFTTGVWLSHRSSMRITEVVVTGTQAVDIVAVKEVAERFLARRLFWKIDRNNYFLYSPRMMRQEIGALDVRVKKVEVSVENLTRLSVAISEYAPAYLWCPPERMHAVSAENPSVNTSAIAPVSGCYFADETGFIFASAPEYSGNIFLVLSTNIPGDDTERFPIGAQILPKEEFAHVLLFLGKLGERGFSPRIVSQSALHDFTVYSDKPWALHWSTDGNTDAQMENLALVLESLHTNRTDEKTLEFIDLRFDNKVFYR